MKWKILTLVAAAAILPTQANAQTNQGQRGGLTRIELLALQQEMRDRGCGNRHAGGEWNAETRAAIKTCKARLNVTGSNRDLLVAMGVGFSTNDSPPPDRNDRAEVRGELGTHPAVSNRATPARRATPATPARRGTRATPAVPATPATPAKPRP